MKNAHRHMWLALGHYGPPPEPLVLPWFRWAMPMISWRRQAYHHLLARIHYATDVRREDMA